MTSAWIAQMFRVQQRDNGGIIRRKKFDVHWYASREELIATVKQLGFHLIETETDYVVFCNSGAFRIIC